MLDCAGNSWIKLKIVIRLYSFMPANGLAANESLIKEEYMSTLLNLILFIVTFVMGAMTCYIWLRRSQFTRERFSFYGFSTLVAFALIYVSNILANTSIFYSLLPFVGLQGLSSTMTPVEIVLLGGVLGGVQIIFLNVFKNWSGVKSEAQYRQEQDRLSSSVLRDISLLLSLGKDKHWLLAPHKASNEPDENFTSIMGLSPVESFVWHVRVRKLWLLRDHNYSIKDEYDAVRQCWLGERKDTNTTVVIACFDEEPLSDILSGLEDYARQVAHKRKQIEIELIITLKNGNIDRETKNENLVLKYISESTLLRKLVNFSDYFTDINQRVEQDKLMGSELTLLDTYIPLDCHVDDGDIKDTNLELYIHDWLEQTTKKQLVLLGNAGCGKTTASLMLCHQLIKKIKNDGCTRVPILIRLREKSLRHMAPLELLATWAYQYNINVAALHYLHIAGRLLLIFDGFDEIDNRDDAESRFNNFKALWSFNHERSKIIITGRPSFFLDNTELKRLTGGPGQSQLLNLVPLNLDQIETVLRAVDAKTRTEILALAKQEPHIFDLITRPSMLYLTMNLWKRNRNFNSAVLMDWFLRECLTTNENNDKNVVVMLSSTERYYFMAGIAVYMAVRDLPNQINHQQLTEAVSLLVASIPEDVSLSTSDMGDKKALPLQSNVRFDWQKQHVEMMTKIITEIRTSGLLVTDLGGIGTYRFAHKLFMEMLQVQIFNKLLILKKIENHKKLKLSDIAIFGHESAVVAVKALKKHLKTKDPFQDPVVGRAIWLSVRNNPLPQGWDQGHFTLTQLKVRNYRSFEKNEWRLSPQFTLLIGDNGTGKTGILDALATALRPLLAAMQKGCEIQIQQSNVRQRTFNKAGQITLEPQYPVEIELDTTIGDNALSWNLTQRAATGTPMPSGYQSVVKLSETLQQAVQEGEDVLLPVIAYYQCNRLWPGDFADPLDTVSPDSRFAGYDNCLNIRAGERVLFAWWKTQTLSSLQNKKPSQLLLTIKHAVVECLVGWSEIEYSIPDDKLMVSNEQGHALPFHMLSDGVRNVLVLVADIAHRAALLNPHLGDKILQQTPGVVLIDEIDMHLHPKWQRRVIEDLKRVFPKIQFIATTHSPFMVQSLRAGELINLNKQSPESYSNRSIEDIAEGVMGVEMPQKSERYQKMLDVADQYYVLLEQVTPDNREEVDRLKEQLDELLIPYNDDPAFSAYLKFQRAVKLQESE